MKNLKEQLSLGANEMRDLRVSNFCANAETNAKLLIAQIEGKIRNLEEKRETLLDLGDDTSIAIATRIKGVDSNELMKEVYELGFEIRENQRILKSMTEDYEILFGKENG